MKNGDEPLWRTILNYGCVAYFLGLPAVALFGALFHLKFDPDNPNVAKFLTDFHFAVTAIVAAVAGLNSFDRRTVATAETKKTNGPRTT